jgi:hypothetical protein
MGVVDENLFQVAHRLLDPARRRFGFQVQHARRPPRGRGKRTAAGNWGESRKSALLCASCGLLGRPLKTSMPPRDATDSPDVTMGTRMGESPMRCPRCGSKSLRKVQRGERKLTLLVRAFVLPICCYRCGHHFYRPTAMAEELPATPPYARSRRAA